MSPLSLRYQISLRILLISLAVISIGGSIAIWQARKSVINEVDSSINLAIQLIKLSLGTDNREEASWLYRLNTLEQTRHLKIQLIKPSGEVINITQDQPQNQLDNAPPSWFFQLVSGQYPKAEYQLRTQDNELITLSIQANPLDEITEAWDETTAFLISIILLVLLSFLVIHLVFDNTLQAISTIVNGVKQIEMGNYKNKIPQFSTAEYNSIATAINNLAEVLNQTHEQNRALTQHSLEIQEEERQRLSQELHDELGQSLTAIKVMAATASHKNADTDKAIKSIVDICDHLITVVRTMMKQLHPLILDELGLKASLEDLIFHWDDRNTDLTLQLECDNRVDQLDHSIIIQVYRVTQECLTNIFRHAQTATQGIIKLELNKDSNKLTLLVIDDGAGCQLEKVNSGFGLLGMQERIKLLGGNISFQSEPGQGMRIQAEIPIIWH